MPFIAGTAGEWQASGCGRPQWSSAKQLKTCAALFGPKIFIHMEKYGDDEVFILVRQNLPEMPEIPPGKAAVDVRRNKITTIRFDPENSIEYLDISDNLIKDISPASGLCKAKVLDCSYNLLESIPVLDLESLRELYLISNDIAKIENIRFSSLEKLDLANNEIRRIENIDSPGITELYLASNKITTVENLAHLPSLKILDLQYNDIEEIDCRALPKTLEILLLQGNTSLRKITNTEHLENLKMVNVRRTKVENARFSGDVKMW